MTSSQPVRPTTAPSSLSLRTARGRSGASVQLIEAAGALARAFGEHGLRRGDVVLTLVGNRIEYLLTILAGLWIGAPVLPCSEQLRAKDIALRLARARPSLIMCDERNRAALDAAAADCPVLTVPDDAVFGRRVAPPFAELADADPAFVLFTSGTTGQPKLVTHAQRWVGGQELQARHWVGALPGELMWSTAAPGWSKATRNSFLAPWLCGASALLQDARLRSGAAAGDHPRGERDVLCMAPTEYRLIAAAGPIGLPPSVRRRSPRANRSATRLRSPGRSRPGWRSPTATGRPRPGTSPACGPASRLRPGRWVGHCPASAPRSSTASWFVDPATVPTFSLGYDGTTVPEGMWRTGDHVRQDDQGWLYFDARADDVIISAGYRIGPSEVESTLLAHPRRPRVRGVRRAR